MCNDQLPARPMRDLPRIILEGQEAADAMRSAALEIPGHMPEIKAMLELSARIVEQLCDELAKETE